MASGLLDFFTGGGQYADPTQVDPMTGAPYGTVRQAFFNQLGNVGAALLAAGQPVEPAVRAQLLAQMGGFGSGMSTDIYKAAQSRLMQTQMQAQLSEQKENERIRALMADPAKFKAEHGFDPSGLGVEDVRSALRQITINKATQDPFKLAARQAASEIFGTGTTVAPAPAQSTGGVVAPVAAPQKVDAISPAAQMTGTSAVPQSNLSDMATLYRRAAADPRIARGDPALAKSYADLATALEDKAALAGRTRAAEKQAELPFELVETVDAEGRKIFVPKTDLMAGKGPVSQSPAEAKAAELKAATPFELVEVQDAEGRKFKIPKSQLLEGKGPTPPTPAEEEVFKKKALRALEKEQLLPRAEVAFYVTNRKSDDLSKKADEALTLANKALTTGMTGAVFRNVPGSTAYDLRQVIDTLVANIGFDELQAMRDASPTGGALGQVAIKEIDLLQKLRGSLDPNQKEETIKKRLEEFKKDLLQLREERRRAFKADFGRDPTEMEAGGFRVLNATQPQQRP